MRLHHTGCDPDFFTRDNTEFNNGPGCWIAIAIIIDDYAEHWRGRSNQENDPQQPPTQVSLNQCHLNAVLSHSLRKYSMGIFG